MQCRLYGESRRDTREEEEQDVWQTGNCEKEEEQREQTVALALTDAMDTFVTSKASW